MLENKRDSGILRWLGLSVNDSTNKRFINIKRRVSCRLSCFDANTFFVDDCLVSWIVRKLLFTFTEEIVVRSSIAVYFYRGY